ncbi:hypothetical protein KI387_018832, partial [Taxus chinensis]
IGAAPSHSGEGDEPINVDSDFEEFTRGETEEEMMEEGAGGEAGGMAKEDDSNSEWHNTQDILRGERAEVSAEKETL